MSDDLISRRAAKLKVARVTWEDGDSCNDFHDKCVDCLDDVPSADNDSLYKELNEAHNEGYDVGYWAGRRDYEQKWIPCSEGLPKKDGRYQVTRHDYVTNTEFIDILWYEENLWWDRYSTGDYAVTAWMSLPKAWSAERKES